MKERLRIQGLRKRWILNSVGPVILILVLAAILASATVANNYYGSARSTLEAKAKAGADTAASDKGGNAEAYTGDFDLKNCISTMEQHKFFDGKFFTDESKA